MELVKILDAVIDGHQLDHRAGKQHQPRRPELGQTGQRGQRRVEPHAP